MKKNLFIIAATALVLASCGDVDTFKNDIQNGNEDEAINFASFTQKATRATENSGANYNWVFLTHHANFAVWGYKNTEITAVFNEDAVTAGGTSPDYTFTYSPKRYWDKSATTYYFYAAAPATASMWTFNGVTNDENQDQSAGYFTTSSTLTGTNLQLETPRTDLYDTFKNKTDVDKLIAAPCVVNKAQFSQTVQFNFIHILSKLNITVRKDPAKLASQTVKLVSFEVENLKATGDFDEHLHAANTAGSNDRWDNQSGAVTYAAKTNWEITTDANYIIESLVIPQDADYELVHLDGKAHAAQPAVYYADLAEYNAAHSTAQLTAEKYAALTTANQTREGYNTATGENIATDEEFDALLATLIKEAAVPAINAVTKYASANAAAASAPYFKIVYTIQDGANSAEQFTAYYNLATVFNEATSLAFNEGWQNTLNITISPDEINFCANVAEWSTNTADPALTIY